MVDRAELAARVLDRGERPVQLDAVDLEPEWARGRVVGLVDGHGMPALVEGDHPAALVGEGAPRVRDDLIDEVGGDDHRLLAYFRAVCLIRSLAPAAFR